jgi:hypothetical protein
MCSDAEHARSITLLKEVKGIKGDLSAVALLSTKIAVQSFQVRKKRVGDASDEASETQLGRLMENQMLDRIRAVLAVPILPQATEISAYYRREIEADLLLLEQDVQRSGIQIPLSRLGSYVSATPFHLAHQVCDYIKKNTIL